MTAIIAFLMGIAFAVALAIMEPVVSNDILHYLREKFGPKD